MTSESRSAPSHLKVPPRAGMPGSEQPTPQLADELQAAFHYFNEELGLKIKPTLIRISRARMAFAWFVPNNVTRFDGAQVLHEINVNDMYFPARSLRDILASVVAIMVEAYFFDDPKRRSLKPGYYPARWARKMSDFGLVVHAAGVPDGPKTGRRMAQRIEDGGRFDEACARLLKQGFTVSWFSRHAAAKPVGMSSVPLMLADIPPSHPDETPVSIAGLSEAGTTRATAVAVLSQVRDDEIPEPLFRHAKVMWERERTKAKGHVKYSCACPVPRHMWGKAGMRAIFCDKCKTELLEDPSKRKYGVRHAV